MSERLNDGRNETNTKMLSTKSICCYRWSTNLSPGFYSNYLQIHTSYTGITTNSQFALITSLKAILITLRFTVSLRWKQTSSSRKAYLLLRQTIVSPWAPLVDVYNGMNNVLNSTPTTSAGWAVSDSVPIKAKGITLLIPRCMIVISNLPYK